MAKTPGRLRAVAALLFASSASFLASCNDGGPTDPPGPGGAVVTVEVTPSADTLTALGETTGLTAVARDAQGAVLGDVEVGWSSSDSTVVSVDLDGTAVATGNGAAEVTAIVDGVTGSVDLAVVQLATTVSVAPGTATLTTVGATQAFAAAAVDANGNAVEDAVFVWDSEDPAVATVDRDGVVTSKGSGTTAISATSQDIPGFADLTVNQVIDRLGFRTGPASSVAGDVLDPAIEIEVLDSAGNRVADAEIAVTLDIGSNPGGGTLQGESKTKTTVGGFVRYSAVSIQEAGVGYTLAASTPGTVTEAESGTFDIAPGPAVQVGFVEAAPDPSTAGDPLNVEVAIQDRFGNTVASATDAVTLELSVSPENGTLVGPVTEPAVAGIATFDATSIEWAAEGYVLAASAPGLTASSGAPFAVAPAAPARLGRPVSSFAPSGPAKAPLDDLVVTVRDAFGNLVPSATPSVTVALGSGAFPGTSVAGDLSVDAVGGIATFPGVSVDKPGTFGLTATAPGLADTVLTTFVLLEPSDLQVTSGGSHSCVATSEGPFCWGENVEGQLGGPTAAPAGDSVAVPADTDLEFARVSPGVAHTCGVTTDEQAYCWGDNASGQLGDGSTVDRAAPVPVAGGEAFQWISAGTSHTCAVSTAGRAYCWGNNADGQLGTGTVGAGSETPVLVTDTLDFVTVVTGRAHTCGWAADQAVHCWGDNARGQLGDGNLGVDSSSPVTVQGGDAFDWLVAGADHTCGIVGTFGPADVECWGANDLGQLDGGSVDSDVPVTVTTIEPVAPGLLPIGAVSAGVGHTCVVRGPEDGIWCWGDNSDGQLGRGSIGGAGLGPGPVAGSDRLVWRAVGAGGAHTCAYANDGDAVRGEIEDDIAEGLSCWGSNGSGQLGNGTTTDSGIIVRVIQGLQDFLF